MNLDALLTKGVFLQVQIIYVCLHWTLNMKIIFFDNVNKMSLDLSTLAFSCPCTYNLMYKHI